MRVIVCGGRDYQNQSRVDEILNSLDGIRHLWHGNAKGADTLADRWGRGKPNVSVHPVPAQWKKYGKRAGPLRNQAMLGQSPDLVVAFKGGRGTADMVKRAEAAGVNILHVTEISSKNEEPQP